MLPLPKATFGEYMHLYPLGALPFLVGHLHVLSSKTSTIDNAIFALFLNGDFISLKMS
jgi:hypothetical protein